MEKMREKDGKMPEMKNRAKLTQAKPISFINIIYIYIKSWIECMYA